MKTTDQINSVTPKYKRNHCKWCKGEYEIKYKHIPCEQHEWLDAIEYYYFDFHIDNMGYSFMNTKTGEVIKKIWLWHMYKDAPAELRSITYGTHLLWKKVDSTDWVDGKYNGWDKDEINTHYPLFKEKKKKIYI